MTQIPHNCIHYQRNENLNKTCTFKGINWMCIIYYDEYCKEYRDERNDTDNNSGSDDI